MFEGFVFLCNCLMVFSEDLNVVEDTVLIILSPPKKVRQADTNV